MEIYVNICKYFRLYMVYFLNVWYSSNMEIEINSNNTYNLLVFLRDILDKRSSLYKETDRLLKEYSKEDIVKICNKILNEE